MENTQTGVVGFQMLRLTIDRHAKKVRPKVPPLFGGGSQSSRPQNRFICLPVHSD
jgi:hypothetical protein